MHKTNTGTLESIELNFRSEEEITHRLLGELSYCSATRSAPLQELRKRDHNASDRFGGQEPLAQQFEVEMHSLTQSPSLKRHRNGIIPHGVAAIGLVHGPWHSNAGINPRHDVGVHLALVHLLQIGSRYELHVQSPIRHDADRKRPLEQAN